MTDRRSKLFLSLSSGLEALLRMRFLCELVCYPSSVCERREIAQVAIFSSLVTQLTCIQCRDHLHAIRSLVLEANSIDKRKNSQTTFFCLGTCASVYMELVAAMLAS